MYEYRKITAMERDQDVGQRQARGLPLHAPPSFHSASGEYLITATRYEHSPIFSALVDSTCLVEETLSAFDRSEIPCRAWVFLPDNYRALLYTEDLMSFSDRLLRSHRHHAATVNWVYYTPVKHGFADTMMSWPGRASTRTWRHMARTSASRHSASIPLTTRDGVGTGRGSATPLRCVAHYERGYERECA